jgi:hypothetical protein
MSKCPRLEAGGSSASAFRNRDNSVALHRGLSATESEIGCRESVSAEAAGVVPGAGNQAGDADSLASRRFPKSNARPERGLGVAIEPERDLLRIEHGPIRTGFEHGRRRRLLHSAPENLLPLALGAPMSLIHGLRTCPASLTDDTQASRVAHRRRPAGCSSCGIERF